MLSGRCKILTWVADFIHLFVQYMLIELLLNNLILTANISINKIGKIFRLHGVYIRFRGKQT